MGKVPINLRVTKENKDRLERYCKAMHQSMTQVVETLIMNLRIPVETSLHEIQGYRTEICAEINEVQVKASGIMVKCNNQGSEWFNANRCTTCEKRQVGKSILKGRH